jgi:thioesterase domain-containing protein/acyl carrier protein
MLLVEVGTPPRDQLEKHLQIILGQLLGLENIGVDQDFFDLGGDSILALRFVADLEKKLSFKLPLSILFEARTVEDLARAIRLHGRRLNWSSLVAVQPLGTKPPLFCVHSHTGDVLYCEYIARGVGPDQPVYGLQSQAVSGNPPHLSVEEMSQHYIKELRRVQPNGPYHLFGFCFGGLVAYEMARQLQAESELVAYLGMYNTPAPGTLKRWPLGKLSLLAKRIRSEWAALQKMQLRRQPGYLLKGLHKFASVLLRTARIDIWRIWGGPGGKKAVLELREKLVNFEELNMAAAMNYAPTSVFPGSITLCLSQDVADMYPTAPEVGWRAFTAKGVNAIDVPLDEAAWRGAPFVETVGGNLKLHISKPQRLAAKHARV